MSLSPTVGPEAIVITAPTHTHPDHCHTGLWDIDRTTGETYTFTTALYPENEDRTWEGVFLKKGGDFPCLGLNEGLLVSSPPSPPQITQLIMSAGCYFSIAQSPAQAIVRGF